MPTTVSKERSERLEARVTPDIKNLIKRAADLQGRTLSDFVVQAASEAATRTVETHQVISLTTKDAEVLVKALLNPPKPGPRLRAAARRYREVMGR